MSEYDEAPDEYEEIYFFPGQTVKWIVPGEFEGMEGKIQRIDHTAGAFLIEFPSYSTTPQWVVPDMVRPVDPQPEGTEFPMPEAPPHGMTSEQLADFVSDFIIACTTRVRGTGHEQYSTEHGQKFEAMGLDELVQMAREEAQDFVVYAAMLDIRLQRIQAALRNKL